MSIISNIYGLTEIYQEILLEYLNSDLTHYIDNFNKNLNHDCEIMQLLGTPTWYNDPDAILEYLEAQVKYNSSVSSEYQITSVVLDIEPWSISSDWEDDFLSTIKTVQTYSQENNLKIYYVVPYWLSTLDGYSTLYQEIIDNSNGVMVMNYNRNIYQTMLTPYLDYSQSQNKEIYSIAELQPVSSSLTSDLTYNQVGLRVLNNNWYNLFIQYNYEKLSFAFDDYTYLKILNTSLQKQNILFLYILNAILRY